MKFINYFLFIYSLFTVINSFSSEISGTQEENKAAESIINIYYKDIYDFKNILMGEVQKLSRDEAKAILEKEIPFLEFCIKYKVDPRTADQYMNKKISYEQFSKSTIDLETLIKIKLLLASMYIVDKQTSKAAILLQEILGNENIAKKYTTEAKLLIASLFESGALIDENFEKVQFPNIDNLKKKYEKFKSEKFKKAIGKKNIKDFSKTKEGYKKYLSIKKNIDQLKREERIKHSDFARDIYSEILKDPLGTERTTREIARQRLEFLEDEDENLIEEEIKIEKLKTIIESIRQKISFLQTTKAHRSTLVKINDRANKTIQLLNLLESDIHNYNIKQVLEKLDVEIFELNNADSDLLNLISKVQSLQQQRLLSSKSGNLQFMKE